MTTGEAKNYQWDYSEQSDILNIHKKDSFVAGSAELGDFTVDFDAQGEIVGIELMNVADFLGESQISPDLLEKIVDADMVIKHRRDGIIYLWIKLVFPGGIERKIPMPAPVMEEARGLLRELQVEKGFKQHRD